MTKVKLLGLFIAILILINISLWIFIFMKSPAERDFRGERHRNEEPKNYIINKLEFDENQILKYENLIEEHQNDLREINDEIKTTKNNLYQLLTNDTYPEKDSLENRLAQLQKEVEEVHFNHFLKIKLLCKPNQIKRFNNLSSDLAKIFAPKRNLPPPPKD